ncbi:hypothetical protein UJ50_001714 [Salmonella enterica subsp. enterica]|nr:hypothetical protein [Salmonella enterica subsp. enterica]
MKTIEDIQSDKKKADISKMKKILFCSIFLLFANILVAEMVPFEWPKIFGTLFSIGIWWGGLGWLWQKFKFRRADDL